MDRFKRYFLVIIKDEDYVIGILGGQSDGRPPCCSHRDRVYFIRIEKKKQLNNNKVFRWKLETISLRATSRSSV